MSQQSSTRHDRSKQTPWTESDMPDQSGRVVIVTGANSGIGYETARALAAKGAHVVLACRTQAKAERAAASIAEQAADVATTVARDHLAERLEPAVLDLADLASVRAFADRVLSRHDRIDLLINNAGVMAVPERSETADGFELQLGTNHLGHFALTGLLLDRILATPGARVVTVSSGAHRFGSMDFDDLQALASYNPRRAYGQSKLANLLFTLELQRRLDAIGADTMSVAAHPGWTETNLQRHTPQVGFLSRFVAQGPEMGALPSLYAAVAPDAEPAGYYGPDGILEMRGHPAEATISSRGRDEESAARLWDVSETLTGVRFAALGKAAHAA